MQVKKFKKKVRLGQSLLIISRINFRHISPITQVSNGQILEVTKNQCSFDFADTQSSKQSFFLYDSSLREREQLDKILFVGL